MLSTFQKSITQKYRWLQEKIFHPKYIFCNIPKLVFYFCILYIIAPELLILLYITGRTEPKLRQKTVFCFTLILLIGNIFNTNYQIPTYQNGLNYPNEQNKQALRFTNQCFI